MRLFNWKPRKVKQQKVVQQESSPPLTILVLDVLFKKLNFETILTARRVCQEWNTYISAYILPKRCILQIIPKSEDSSKWTKRTSKLRKWVPKLSVNWMEIHVQELETSRVLWKKEIYDFSSVIAMTLIESDFRLYDFVNILMARMNGLRHLRISDNEFTEGAAYHFCGDTYSALFELSTMLKSWAQGLQNLHRLETFQLGIFCWYTSMIYLKVVQLSKPKHLREIYLDFSRSVVHLCTPKLREMYEWIAKLVTAAEKTLEVFKLKFTRRVETDGHIMSYGVHTSPFHEFMEALLQWPSPESLRLKTLKFLFPNVEFEHGHVDAIFVPYLKNLPKLETLFIGRCRVDFGFHRFHLQFHEISGLRLSYSMFQNDYETSLGILSKYPNLSCIELQTMWSAGYDVSLISNRIYWGRNGFRDRAARVKSFRAVNSRFNFHFRFFNIPEILSTFTNLEELELLDNSMPLINCQSSHQGAIIGDNLFSHILETYPRLRSLKLSNLLLLTDSGITGLSEKIIQRMETVGSYNLGKRDMPVVSRLETMKELQFLELRNLTKRVSDISVYLAFKNIPKLEKIAFHGEHKITPWGVTVLNQKFKRNNLFKVYLKAQVSSPTFCDFP